MAESPQEIPGREEYYEAAFICITLFCDSCGATLDPDNDLGEGLGYASEGWVVRLGDEAFNRGWKIGWAEERDMYSIRCPECAAKVTGSS